MGESCLSEWTDQECARSVLAESADVTVVKSCQEGRGCGMAY
jgi:hypothetical protein